MGYIAKTNFNMDGIYYDVGDEVTAKDKEQLIKINEKGFIEPLTPKQIQEYFGKKIKNKEEE